MKKALLVLTIIICVAAVSFAEDKPAPKDGATVQAAPSEKPYGCFRDLRWGMSPEQANSSLGIKLKKNPIPLGKLYGYWADIKISERDYKLACWFENNMLVEVYLQPKDIYSFGQPDGEKARIMLAAYGELKPGLTQKYGEPVEDFKEDRGDNAVFINNLLEHKAIVATKWEAEEGSISLIVECVPEVISKTKVYNFSPLLLYKMKVAGKNKATASDL